MKDQDKTLMMLIGDVHRQFGHKIRELEKKNGLGPCSGSILLELSKNDSLTQVELVDKIHMRPSSISVALQKMEQDGLIERKVKAEDQRCSIVCITDKGKAINEKMKFEIYSMDNFFTKQLNDNDLQNAKNIILRLSNILREEENENI